VETTGKTAETVAKTVVVDSVSTSIWTTTAGKVMIAITVALLSMGVIFGAVFELIDAFSPLIPERNEWVDIEDSKDDYIVEDVVTEDDFVAEENVPGDFTEVVVPESSEVVSQPEEVIPPSEVQTEEVVVEQGPQIVKVTDPTLMERKEMGTLDVQYSQEYTRSVSKGTVPSYSDYEYTLRYFRNDGSWSSYDEAYFGSHPEFEINGQAAPIFVFADSVKNDSNATDMFVTSASAVREKTYRDSKWESWGKLADLPEEISSKLQEIVDYVWNNEMYSEAEVVSFASNHTPEFVDEKGRAVYGYEGHKVYVIENDHARNTGLTADMGSAYRTWEKDGLAELPLEQEIYVTIGEGEETQYYLMTLNSVSMYQNVELNYISENENRFASAMEAYWMYGASVGVTVSVYELEDEIVVE